MHGNRAENETKSIYGPRRCMCLRNLGEAQLLVRHEECTATGGLYDAITSITRSRHVKARRRDWTNWAHARKAQHQHAQHNTMESPHPDERPVKKRRFFIEDSSPTQPQSKPFEPPPSSPPPHAAETPDESHGNEEEADFGSLDVGMLQAVVGELSHAVLQKLKDVSGSNVERGMPVSVRLYLHG